jgi:hypothetical protein
LPITSGKLCRFLDAGNKEAPHAQLTGVQKAPRHEVAGSWAPAKQRALWGFNAGAGRDDRRKLLKIAGGCTIIAALDGASLGSPRGDAGGILSGIDLSPQPINSAAPYVPTSCGRCASACPDGGAHCDVCSMACRPQHRGPLRIVRLQTTRQSTIPYGERWIEKSTHRSREDMLCEHR